MTPVIPTLTVSDEVRALAPGFTHLAVEAHHLANGPSTEDTAALLDDASRRLAARCCQAVRPRSSCGA